MRIDLSTQYGPVFSELLRESRLAPLGPGTGNAEALPLLRKMTSQAFDHVRVIDKDMAQCCLAGVWLYHDFLDESHTICQDIATADGSYWHALMHRREPDYSNSKYWFRRVGDHPIFHPLRIASQELAGGATAEAGFLIRQTAWDPFAFVDLCESCVNGRANATMLCRQIQQREWELLFEYCYAHAIGSSPARGRD